MISFVTCCSYIGTEEHIRPLFDLIAVEVTLDLASLYAIPYVEPEPLDKQKGSASSNQRDAHTSSVGTPGKKKKAPPTPQQKLPKSLPSPVFHQLVGIFTTSAERPPPALDLGLFEWSYFVNVANIINGPLDVPDDMSTVTAKTSTTLHGESGTLPSITSAGDENLSTSGTSRFHGPKWRHVEADSGIFMMFMMFFFYNTIFFHV